ncbi:MAG: eukaryotic-like serine/threonine-protein kinase [Solirubrobacteraceae bacterium]|nr:eukaryotic-like serine/threonine-protein kinase [Solirubrobacteraceae bacterium]
MPDVTKTVGRYEVLNELGRGGMALVYLARQTDLDRYVALKELGAFHASDPSFAQRFLRESRVAGSLSHPNIVTVHDYFEHDGTPYIAMEYVERGSLRPYVGQMDLAQIGGVLEGLLAGLAAAEAHGIVHRDLKPENLMVTSDGRVKIADFGIAKATTRMQTGAFLTATGTTVGTPTYMAPEQAMAQEVGPWTDIYSVGCMAYEMFTGRVPFHDSEAPMAILLRHVNEQIPAASSVSDTDDEVSEWIDRMLVKDPKARTQSAGEAWDDFEELIIGRLGPRWRRAARLGTEPGETSAGPSTMTPKPLTPAPFEGAPDNSNGGDEFQSFAWGQSAAPPGPATPPPSEAVPLPPEPVVGPPTPVPPSEAVPPPPPPLAPPAAAEPAFETFIAPESPRPPVADSPLAAPPPDPAPAPPPPPAPPVREPAPEPAAAPPPPPAPVPPAPEPPAREPVAEPAATVMPASVDPPRAEPAAERREPERAKPPASRSVLPFAIGAAVVLAVIGFVVGSSGGGSKPAPAKAATGVTVASPAVELRGPSGWAKSTDTATIPGVTYKDPVAVASGGKRIVAGQTAPDAGAENFLLLPNAVSQAIGGVPKARPAVKLPGTGQPAFRYADLQVQGIDGGVTMFALQTAGGVFNVACIGGVSPQECDSAAASLKVKGGPAVAVGPDAGFATSLSGILGTLGQARAAGRKKLGSASGNKGQAAAAQSVSAAYAAAIKRLTGLKVHPADRGQIDIMGGAFQRSKSAYAVLAAAARKNNRSAYVRGQNAVRNAEKDVAGAMAALKVAGYDVKG